MDDRTRLRALRILAELDTARQLSTNERLEHYGLRGVDLLFAELKQIIENA